MPYKLHVNPIRPRLLGGDWALEGGGGVGWWWERKEPAVHNSKTIYGIEMKFGREKENHKLINLV